MISPYLLLFALLSSNTADEETMSLTAKQINALKTRLSESYLECDFSQLSFKQIELEYSQYVRVETTIIRIERSKEFKKILDKRTKFIQDKQLVDSIIDKWEK